MHGTLTDPARLREQFLAEDPEGFDSGSRSGKRRSVVE
ncbi:hypothetical protein SM11_chr0954 [Sinorhizobium meliloti SM11]|uniref:Uncharacterized protein n=1 Tax=Sinorhizobium meliloti (strain SM11) TaxID=707241 RepID=F7X2L9_SINMM|nr:hypothetical protein SM11_chr0954 [Sinorhizobium meliloti SM11]